MARRRKGKKSSIKRIRTHEGNMARGGESSIEAVTYEGNMAIGGGQSSIEAVTPRVTHKFEVSMAIGEQSSIEAVTQEGSMMRGGESSIEAVTYEGNMAIGGQSSIDAVTHKFEGSMAIGEQSSIEAVTDEGSMAIGGHSSIEAVTHQGSMAIGGQSSIEAVTHECSMAIGGQSSAEVETHESSMVIVNGQDSKEATRTFFDLPEDVVLRIMALLPLESLFRSRAVAPKWNATVLDPHFQRLRHSLQPRHLQHLDVNALQDLVKCIAQKFHLRLWRLYNFDGTNIAGGLLTVVDDEDVLVLQPSRLSARLLPRVECPGGIERLYCLSVVGLVVTEATQDFAVFVTFRVSRTSRRNRILPVGQGPKDMALHRYNSTRNVWTACGKGLHRDLKRMKIRSIIMHRGHYMGLVRNHDLRSNNNRLIDFSYDLFYFNEFKWEILPGQLPGELRWVYPGHLSLLGDEPDGISIFDHRGMLYLAKPSKVGCLLWKYDDDAAQWVLIRMFQSPLRVDVESGEQCWDDEIEIPYSEHLGDCLHFGDFEQPLGSEPVAEGSSRRCRMLMYNLITRKLTDLDKSDEGVQCLLARQGLQKARLEN